MCPTSSDQGVKIVSDKMSFEKAGETVPIEHYRLIQRQLAQLELENSRLTGQLREVIGMNTRWQKYDQQREAYVLKLHAANKDLHTRLSAKQRELEQLMEQQSREKLRVERSDISNVTSALNGANLNEQTTGSNTNSTAPMCALDANLARKEKELFTMQDQVERLEEQVRSLQRNETKLRDDADEKISIFKAQLEVCMEDFRLERSDRQKMHEERLRLRKQLHEAEMTVARLHEEISDLVEETRWLRDRPSRLTHHYSKPAASPVIPRYRYNYTRANSNLPQLERGGGARGRGADYPDLDSISGFPSDVTIDRVTIEPNTDHVSPSMLASPPPSPDMPKCASAPASLKVNPNRVPFSRTSSNGTDEASELDEDDEVKALRCPQCLDEFTVKEHDRFLKHTEFCCGTPSRIGSC